MLLDQSLMNLPPTPNRVLEGGFKNFPVYVKEEFLLAHRYARHVQPGIEINLTLEGKGAYVVDNQIYMQSSGQLIIFFGHIPHQIYVDPSSNYRRTVVCYRQDTDNDPLLHHVDFNWLSAHGCKHIPLKPEMYAQLKWIVSLMDDEYEEKRSGWQHVISSQLASLAVLVRRSIEESYHLEEEKWGAHTRTVALCCEYIDKHIYEDLSLQNVSSLFHITPEHLTRLFKREKGLSFYQYVLQQRVFLCQRLLLESPYMTLTDIAYTAGFTSSGQFSRVFKTLTGISPSQYRGQLLQR